MVLVMVHIMMTHLVISLFWILMVYNDDLVVPIHQDAFMGKLSTQIFWFINGHQYSQLPGYGQATPWVCG